MIQKIKDRLKSLTRKQLITVGLSLLVLSLAPVTYLSIQKLYIQATAERAVTVSKDMEVRIDGPIQNLVAEVKKVNDLVQAGHRDIRISISSPGGRIDVMNDFIRVMETAKYHGVKFTCTVVDMAASAAVVILSQCDRRYAKYGAQIMWHSASIMKLARMNEANVGKLLNFFLITNETIWADTRKFFWPSYFIKHFNAETMLLASEVEQNGFGFLTVVASYKYEGVEQVDVPAYSPPPAQANVTVGKFR